MCRSAQIVETGTMRTKCAQLLTAVMPMNEIEPRLSIAALSDSNPVPSKREVKNKSNITSRKRYGWRNRSPLTKTQTPVYYVTLL